MAIELSEEARAKIAKLREDSERWLKERKEKYENVPCPYAMDQHFGACRRCVGLRSNHDPSCEDFEMFWNIAVNRLTQEPDPYDW